MRQSWNRYAFIRFVLFLAIGIIAGVFLPEYFTFVFCLLILLAFSYFAVHLLRGSQFKISLSISFSVMAFLICFAFGYLNAYWQAEKHASNHLLSFDETEIEAFDGKLINRGKPTPKTYGFKASVSRLKIAGQWYPVTGKVLLYLEKDSISEKLQYGDVLLVKGKLSELEPPRNPLEFNYKRFLGFDQIYHQQYIPQSDFIKIDSSKGNSIIAASIKTGQFLEEQLDKYITNPRSLAITKALTLGVKDELDNDLRNAYATAGAMHVLAVSGLHVGIIFLIVASLLRKWRYHKNGRFFFACVSLFVLWFYAFITGLSPSVLRAATMFSFIIIAQSARKRTNIYNTLAASAFVLLSFDPYLLFSVGFQLSYLAVLGIVFFQPKLYKLLQFKYVLADKIWAITCVSVAAQLATAPLGLLYFHQFPTYFFLSNLVVIPAAFVILNSTLVLLSISFLPALATVWGSLIDYFIQGVNFLVFGLDVFPKSTIDGIFITTAEAWAIYLMIACMALIIAERKSGYLVAAFMLSIGFSVSLIARQIENANTNYLTVYDVGNTNAMAVRSGFDQFLWVSEELAADKNKLRFHVYPSQLQAGIADFHPDKFEPKNQLNIFKKWQGISFSVWQNKTIAYWDVKASDSIHLAEELPIDLLILSNDAVRKPEQIRQFFRPALIIIDASNSYFTIQKLKANFEEENIDFYVVSEKGAFELKI
ncbi:ComEC/Rec2 family competence protein [Marivirga sp. S37H4]|uniref:ComEC/Rec2 family competence protein n=1 Tax=Marivirga aurantiaca TaxID=2802615 RepID=A0A934WXJ6_9BACT|nr:ComEC/Rec2 family competence protein [Marivirga aurantiaca]MBK6264752.1 ComEC/Rec2 family competence protein [Marivirga aurantiaca]